MEDSKVGIKSKKKNKKLTADSLDNKASVEAIIEFILANQSQSKIYRLYSLAVRQRRTTLRLLIKHFLLPGHPLNKFSEAWDGGLNRGYFETFSHRSMMPRMISQIRHIENKDPVTEYMKTKMKWEDTMRDYKRIMALMGRKRKYELIDEDILHCPKQMVEIAAHFENNPDPYFESSYNWYYAGHGNMHLISFNGLDYLLFSEFSCVYVAHFSIHNLTIDYEDITKFECGKDQNILENVSSQNIIAIRTKHKIFILKICQPVDTIFIEKIKEMESELPFTGISFDEYHKNILYVTTLDYRLTIVNIDRMTGRSKQLRGTVETLVDNWSTVSGTQRGFFTHVSKHGITLYDKRTNNAFQRWKGHRKITDEVTCNDISVAQYGTDKNLMYIGTDHHVLLMDLRYNKVEKNKLQAVQRWTHGMQCVPTYMTVTKFEYGKELVCLSSQWCEDMCVFSNHSDRLTRTSDISSVTIPYRPPSILQVLNEAKERILCNDLYNPIDNRLCTSISGLSVLEQDDKYHVMMLNSLGDVSCHVLCPEAMTAFFEDTSVDLLNEWSQGFKQKEKVFEVSSIQDISLVLRCLKRIPDYYNLGENVLTQKVNKFNEQEISDVFVSEELEAGLLEAWTKQTENSTAVDESSLNLFFCNDDEEK